MKIGTPENPEIIEPGQSRPMNSGAPDEGRLRRAVRILGMMLRFTAPAFCLDSVCIWLWDAGHANGFAWLFLVVLLFPAFILSGLALIVDLFLGFALIATLTGRPVSVVQAPFARFVRYPGRDVTPPPK